MEEKLTNQKETDRAIKAAVDQSEKFPKKKEKFQKKKEVCSTCQCEFDLDAEGGTKGEFGIIPVAAIVLSGHMDIFRGRTSIRFSSLIEQSSSLP